MVKPYGVEENARHGVEAGDMDIGRHWEYAMSWELPPLAPFLDGRGSNGSNGADGRAGNHGPSRAGSQVGAVKLRGRPG
ncbi:hypothetical protein CSOJ01_12249 [Colletotrichum sojae]|uniref:Uncharacterized protein n=1 Tax=Colletotrichum sojae TaxID=2175907 RepID=A0A8H6IW26_9PEZI|nr:hypothetical protein CSOJ01_12249 [Colletotrichum sojae]